MVKTMTETPCCPPPGKRDRTRVALIEAAIDVLAEKGLEDIAQFVQAVAFDTPIAGWRGRHVNTLRLWSARAPG